MKTNTINNLVDFLTHFGATTPADAGRQIYRHSCGLNTQFNVTTRKPFTATLNVTITLKEGKLHASVEETMDDDTNALAGEALCFLGFGEDHTIHTPSKLPRSLKGYAEKARVFFDSEKSSKYGRRFTGTVLPTHPHSGEPNSRAVFIQLTKDVPAEVETVNYSDKKAQAPLENCTGVNFSSIVEGSDVEVDGYSLDFPFTEQQLEDTLKGINDEVSFYWERDNVDSYHVSYKGKDYYFDHSGKHDQMKPLPTSIRQAVLDFVESIDSDGLDEDGDMTPVPNTKATVEKLDKSDFIF